MQRNLKNGQGINNLGPENGPQNGAITRIKIRNNHFSLLSLDTTIIASRPHRPVEGGARRCTPDQGVPGGS